ncbi:MULTISPECIES: RimK family alpha-L-glutamate ligase [Glaesserella]|uniref:30S ribosomal protein S6--L-glutamate ligase n=1 Tax=Glaesserella australis TaxID=2094024 RepID=A0A328C1U1_9PAST|nr:MULTISPECIES: RimK family alpha-L-glutamate ligase [Glaesserella]AUI65540.1 30S ribosomal protein S6--L-glutamate ligase [Glaesserella sp. 15-184]RAL19737.1 30S ribosomal protein S6--L-glutamate ligase [Glaesserella australis]
MKLLMLCREPRLYSCQRLKQAAENVGYQLDILDPNRFLLKLEQGRFELFYQTGETYDKARPAPEKIAEYAGILPRFGTTSTEMGCNVLRHFEQKQIPVLNNASAFALARDKWKSLQQLTACGISVPDTVLAGECYATSESLAQFDLPTVIKTLSGSQGVGVMLAESYGSALSLLETLKSAKVPSLLQRFISESKGEDIRAFVIGDKVVAAMQRKGSSNEFRANIHRGGTAEPILLSSEEQALAVKATQALGLDVAGVDLIRSQHGLMVLEVNASPGLEMIEKVSSVDIASLMIEKLRHKFL